MFNMKSFLLFLIIFICLQSSVLANTAFITDDGLWGLKDSSGQILIEPEYKKLISLGCNSYIVQKRGKFGLINFNNKILVPIKYSSADRLLGKYLKVSTGSKCGLYDEFGTELLPVEYSSIDILFGGMFLTAKSYKYGVIDSTGKVVLENMFDEIYMPQANIMRLKYLGREYEIEYLGGSTFVLPEEISSIKTDKNYLISEITQQPMTVAGYSAVTATDYLLKLVSSISPAHEKTIDSLMLSKGVDAVGIYFRLGWIVKYPFVFAKNYYNNIKDPNNGPLSEVKTNLKQKLTE